MQSRVNPLITVTKENYAVSLVRQHYHAYIVVEKLGTGLELCSYDFVSRDGISCPLSVYGLFKNTAYIGRVREGGYKHQIITNGENISRKALFNKRHWHKHDVLSWICPADDARRMIDAIRQDIALSQQDHLMISLKGAPVQNCTTWAMDKLHVANIYINVPNNISVHFSLQAKGIIGSRFPGFFNHKKCKLKREFVNTLTPVTEAIQIPYKKLV